MLLGPGIVVPDPFFIPSDSVPTKIQDKYKNFDDFSDTYLI